MGLEPDKLDYLVLSKGNFEILIRKLLLVKRYRVEIYVSEGSTKNNEWRLEYKGSPGNLSQLEEVLGDGLGTANENAPCLMAVNFKTDAVTKGRLLGVACVTAADYQFSISEFTDDDLLTQLETITVQTAPAECLVIQGDNKDQKALKKVMQRANVTVTKLKRSDFSTEGLIQDLNRLLKFKNNQSQDANAFPETRKEVAMSSLAAAIRYTTLLNENTNFGRFHLTTITTAGFLHLDAAALTALNVFPELGDISHSPTRSIYGLLDRCRTQHGKRFHLTTITTAGFLHLDAAALTALNVFPELGDISHSPTRSEYLVKASFDEQLQSLRSELDRLQVAAERQLRAAADSLGLDPGKTIKLENNPQNGFYFRITNKEEHAIRGSKKFTIIDAVKGGVRFKNNSLENITDEYVQTKDTYEREQDKVVAEIVNIASGYSECLFNLSHMISRVDVLVSMSVAACSAPLPYCRPVITDSMEELLLSEVRHPCLEVQEGVSYIPNDVHFKRGKCVMHIITGANMGGKSTWMRSCGAAVLLAHAGTATPDSLVLIDELGRGTSTYEGCGIAWAIAEKLATESQCFCLFATHYHELTRLEAQHPGVIVNSHAQASVVDGQLLLLHRIQPGAAPHSLGLHVAKLADLPDYIIQYAEEKQSQLETNLFEIEASMKSQETSEGQEIILDFLRKCKQINESVTSDEEMMKEIDKLKRELQQHNSKYLQSLIA
ncbi:DNA mismatch repair protein Msh2 [Papilio machaon]|uniref:DNA mismatch repair protein Msh2 n=1 Tax=Papilio machaon TaxID=76193 RepID=A0A194RQY9_PAPMA|nr:DNA mismatch repair protein Msh2 [Papilio machaon]